MDNRRNGLSITFGYLIVGVIGLVTFIVVVGGFDLGFSSSVNILSGWGESGSIDTACNQLADRVNDEYCSQYVSDCSDIHHEYDSSQGYTETASDAGCEWYGSDVPDAVASHLEAVDGEYRPIVTVDGDTYDCIEEGELPRDPTCPAR